MGTLLGSRAFLPRTMAVASADGLLEESLKRTKTSKVNGMNPSDNANSILYEMNQIKKAKKSKHTVSYRAFKWTFRPVRKAIASQLNEMT